MNVKKKDLDKMLSLLCSHNRFQYPSIIPRHVVGIVFAEQGHESVTLVQFHGGLFLPLEGQRVGLKHDENRRIILGGSDMKTDS